jgi:hypothetical protein
MCLVCSAVTFQYKITAMFSITEGQTGLSVRLQHSWKFRQCLAADSSYTRSLADGAMPRECRNAVSYLCRAETTWWPQAELNPLRWLLNADCWLLKQTPAAFSVCSHTSLDCHRDGLLPHSEGSVFESPRRYRLYRGSSISLATLRDDPLIRSQGFLANLLKLNISECRVLWAWYVILLICELYITVVRLLPDKA